MAIEFRAAGSYWGMNCSEAVRPERGTAYATRAFPMGSGGNCRVCVSARTIVLMEWVAGTVPIYLDRWAIQPHGDTVTTPSSWLVPGRWHDRDVMLKVARIAEEDRGGPVLAWWAGSAAAEVYEVSDQAVLMNRAAGLDHDEPDRS